VALVRVEQLYPFPHDEIVAEINRIQGAKDVVWVQEEPENMGAWSYINRRFDDAIAASTLKGQRVAYVGRPASASPATGSAQIHAAQQAAIMREALHTD
jgi:2-oxoglutarate dehydrogenase complex dehydrogenase (E1) component-like enzyme